MLGIIRLALNRPYTFVVLAILILIIGPLALLRTPVDIFPNIKLPVISVVWNYNGLPPDEMSDRIITYFERQMTTTVNDIEHIESQSLPGVGVIKVFFQPGVDINAALAQVTAVSQTVLKRLPPGITPPLVLSYNASSVPVLQLALSSKTMTDQQLFDLSNNFIRPQLAEVEGAAIPSPYGGKNRQVVVDLKPDALRSKGLSPQDVTNAIIAQNLILPSGTEKVGKFEYNVKLNGSPKEIEDLNNLPIKTVAGATIYLHDVAHVRDGYSPQQNLVLVNGQRSVLTTVQKNGNASTLDIIAHVKRLLPKIEAGAPPGLILDTLIDQSVFVKAAVAGVAREGVIAAALTALMILLFLGSWRSTLIITISIPLAVLSSIAALSAIGETINVMTLGGLALAIGILVDDATVTIENINWHLEQGKERRRCHSGWQSSDRRPSPGFAAVHLHRVRADVLPGRRCPLSVRADGRGRGVRADRLVRAVAHPGADPGQISVAPARRPACSDDAPARRRDARRSDRTYVGRYRRTVAVSARLRTPF